MIKTSKANSYKSGKVIDQFKINPYPKGYKKLKGSDKDYRVRIGDYRILYSVYDNVLIVEVIKIAHRKDVYKK
ncbi:MAG TPA: type II toxin-antitoxin system RelE/ParE family toxin [Bacteroidales bacterium]|nr:type II toxin-antitoxin system RelE/ParE family toxin [Bacteroidales bacterium]